MPKQVSSSWKWAFTLNNYDIATQIHMESVCANEGLCIIAVPEVAPTTGTPHLQGAVCSMVQRKDKQGVMRYPAWRPTVFGRHTSGSGRPADNGKKADPMLIDCELPDSTCKIAFTRMMASPQSNYEYCMKSLQDWTESMGKPDIMLDTFPLKFRPKPDWLLGDSAPAVIAAKKWKTFTTDCRMLFLLVNKRLCMMSHIIRIGYERWPSIDDCYILQDTQYWKNMKRTIDDYNEPWDVVAFGPNERWFPGWREQQLNEHFRKYRLMDGEAEKVAYRFEEKWNITSSEILGAMRNYRWGVDLDNMLTVFKERV